MGSDVGQDHVQLLFFHVCKVTAGVDHVVRAYSLGSIGPLSRQDHVQLCTVRPRPFQGTCDAHVALGAGQEDGVHLRFPTGRVEQRHVRDHQRHALLPSSFHARLSRTFHARMDGCFQLRQHTTTRRLPSRPRSFFVVCDTRSSRPAAQTSEGRVHVAKRRTDRTPNARGRKEGRKEGAARRIDHEPVRLARRRIRVRTVGPVVVDVSVPSRVLGVDVQGAGPEEEVRGQVGARDRIFQRHRKSDGHPIGRTRRRRRARVVGRSAASGHLRRTGATVSRAQLSQSRGPFGTTRIHATHTRRDGRHRRATRVQQRRIHVDWILPPNARGKADGKLGMQRGLCHANHAPLRRQDEGEEAEGMRGVHVFGGGFHAQSLHRALRGDQELPLLVRRFLGCRSQVLWHRRAGGPSIPGGLPFLRQGPQAGRAGFLPEVLGRSERASGRDLRERRPNGVEGHRPRGGPLPPADEAGRLQLLGHAHGVRRPRHERFPTARRRLKGIAVLQPRRSHGPCTSPIDGPTKDVRFWVQAKAMNVPRRRARHAGRTSSTHPRARLHRAWARNGTRAWSVPHPTVHRVHTCRRGTRGCGASRGDARRSASLPSPPMPPTLRGRSCWTRMAWCGTRMRWKRTAATGADVTWDGAARCSNRARRRRCSACCATATSIASPWCRKAATPDWWAAAFRCATRWC
mmetsp:Transcript_853/g.5319  ORF Transcript_853/g.5319 Transcript_853/m.5319 type:complete len:686 (-) Transcript_853:2337-4394(-)